MKPDPTAPIGVLVYGSCVARDTVEAAPEGTFDLVGYIARMSLLSAGTDATGSFPADISLASDFQQRMLTADVAGDLTGQLAQHGPDADVLLWDLTDERHGIYEFADGSIITRSIDVISVPEALTELEDAAERRLPFGDEEHFRRWSARAEEFAASLRELGLFERTVVLQVPWALVTVTGEPTPWSMGVRAADANAQYARYYQHLRELGFAVLEMQPLAVLADPEHRWGLAPFHYTAEVYAEILRRLREEYGVSPADHPGESPAAGTPDAADPAAEQSPPAPGDAADPR